MELFQAALKALRVLKDAGHEAWLVGGSVRDHLLGTATEDITEFDVATDARPEEVAGLFRRSIPVGKAFGVVRVGIGPHWMEVATFRTEADYADGRHPETVEFATAEEDVRRRDFTVNGLLWDPDSDEIRDYVGGQDDVRNGVIRAIGDPDERFREDGLRLLRAVRFGAWREFSLDDATRAAVQRNKDRLRAVSAERMREELLKMSERAASRRGDAWRELVRTGLAPIVLGIDPHPDVDGVAAVIDALQHRDLTLWLAVVSRHVLDPGAPPAAWRRCAAEIVERIRGSVEERDRLGALLGDRARYRNLVAAGLVRRRLAATRDDREYHEDLLGAEGDAAAVLDVLDADRQAHGDVRPEPLLDGRRLIAAGVKPGPRLGWLLRKIRVLQLRGELSSAEEALASVGLPV